MDWILSFHTLGKILFCFLLYLMGLLKKKKIQETIVLPTECGLCSYSEISQGGNAGEMGILRYLQSNNTVHSTALLALCSRLGCAVSSKPSLPTYSSLKLPDNKDDLKNTGTSTS